jgi:hypothetical protein
MQTSERAETATFTSALFLFLGLAALIFCPIRADAAH